MRPTAARLLHILVPVKRCDETIGNSNSFGATDGTQVCRLCGEDPRQPSTDGNRHQREALDGAPLEFSLS
jgi:hypothetical protein